MERCAVTGAAGYLGQALTAALVARGHEVVAIDATTVAPSPGIIPMRVDIRDSRALVATFSNVDVVFHTASVIDPSTICSPERRKRSWDINVGGTQNVVCAALEAGVGRLIYTSSSTVVFDGHAANVVTEDAPYPDKPVDLYTATKAKAEKAVLAANGSELLTCALRPTGIFGPGERHHLPRVIDEAARGRLKVQFGSADALSEWSYIDNVVHAHLLAMHALRPGAAACGQAYFINDEWYAESFELFRILLEGVGLPTPRFRIPSRPAVVLARVWEWAHWRLHAPEPLVTPLEMMQLAVSHPCSIDKARRDLGYEPIVSMDEAVARTLPYCEALLRARRGETVVLEPTR
jgi:3beta-hydroxy-delta5-steroid dehydrogenase/steroid delta-isomerase